MSEDAFTIVKVAGSGLVCTVISWATLFGLDKYADYRYEHQDDEDGVVIEKVEPNGLAVDINGDKEPDRVIRFVRNGTEYYDYSQPGDKISYKNKGAKSVVDIDLRYKSGNKIRTINGKTPDEIKKWVELNKYVKTKSR